MPKTMINPLTNRKIIVGGPTHKKLLKSKSISPRGWASVSPQRGTERQVLMKNCGKKCFLDPKNKKYPICAKGKGCKIDCRGLASAKIRSIQYGNEDITKLALRLQKKLCIA